MKRQLLLLALLAGVAVAVEYRIETSGGPDALDEWVSSAFEQWREAAEEDFEPRLTEDAQTLFAYDEDDLAGPDTVSVTVSRVRGDERSLEVLVNPALEGLLPRALLHEGGLVLGLSPAEEGVMSPFLADDAPAELSEADVTAFRAMQGALPGDINRDGVVDFYDLLLLAKDFGRRGAGLAADITGDGVVDDRDLEVLIEAYTFLEPSQSPPGETVSEPAADIEPADPADLDLPDGETVPDTPPPAEDNEDNEEDEPAEPPDDELDDDEAEAGAGAEYTGEDDGE